MDVTHGGVKRSNIKTALFFSILYAFILFAMPVDGFMDRVSYINNYGSKSLIYLVDYALQGFLSLMFNEPVWLSLNLLLSYFLEPDNMVRWIVFISVFLTTYSFLRFGEAGVFLLLLIITMPFVLKNFTAHIRQGLAIGVFISAFHFIGWRRLLFFIVAPLIHSSFFFILLFYWIAYCFNTVSLDNRKLNWDISFILFGVLSVAIIILLPFVSAKLGTRQGDLYEFSGSSGSGLALLFWFVILSIFLMQPRAWINNNIFSLIIIVFYLISYFYIEVTARIFESGILFILLSILSMKGLSRQVAVLLMLLLGLYQWIPNENSLVHFL